MTSRGVLEKWVLKLFGSPMTPSQVQDRIRYQVLCHVRAVVVLVEFSHSSELFLVDFQ